MKKLLSYLRTIPRSLREEIAQSCDTSVAYIRKACNVGQLLSPARCVVIEQMSHGVVTRKDLRPDDWKLIWPELVCPSQEFANHTDQHPNDRRLIEPEFQDNSPEEPPKNTNGSGSDTDEQHINSLIMNKVWEENLPIARKIVLLYLADNADKHGESSLTVRSISSKCSLQDRAVYDCLNDLVKNGYLIRIPRSGKSSVYRITFPFLSVS